MNQPILLEESTPFKLSRVLERLMTSLPRNASHHDHLMAALIVLLAEAGFWPYEMTVDNTVKRWHTDLLKIPEKLKTEDGIYRMKLSLPILPHKVCKLIAIPTGDVLVVNLIPPSENVTTGYNMAIQTLKYFNPHSSDLAGRYINLKELSFRFKDGLTTPLRTDLLQDEGIINPSLQGLPVEIKLHILKMLPIRTVRRIGECNRELYSLSKAPEIRRYFKT
ncbi:uncharacterized protein LOC107271584 [Cephus cinctus]|uniref:Uncharacterized protein LOC107271584 n=1 Tax=Cephus cinctus TaxID=211228 RepID=A0AAJ7C6Q8_CEPCN|nr:uncharacterized protein LOC107271584 [Cephus cinctus]